MQMRKVKPKQSLFAKRKRFIAARKRKQALHNFACSFAAAIIFVAVLTMPYAQHYFF
jgi:hypothetical protein